jgi:hypothetical protein
MEDPTDDETISNLQKMFGVAIEPAICSSGEVELLLSEILDVWHDSR